MYSDIEISQPPRDELLLAIKILKFKVFNFLGGQLWSALVTFINPALLQFDERRQETGLGVGLGCNVSSEGVVTAQKTRSYNIYVTQDIYYLDNWTFWN